MHVKRCLRALLGLGLLVIVLVHCATDTPNGPTVGAASAPLLFKITGSSWLPLGPELTALGQNGNLDAATNVTGRVSAIAVNPLNPLGDVFVGAASGGVWHRGASASPSWTPLTDDQPSLAVGVIRLSDCNVTRCNTVWVGTGESSARRDTYYGRGVLKGSWNSSAGKYTWTQHGASQFSLGSITGMVVDPDDPSRAWIALASGVTSNATHSSIATQPNGSLGIWRTIDGGATWTNILSTGAIPTDLEIDPGDTNTLYAGFQGLGVYQTSNGGSTWALINGNITAQAVAAGQWPELAVTRSGGLTTPVLYLALPSGCPSPFTEVPEIYWCGSNVYRSTNNGALWTLMSSSSGIPAYGKPLSVIAPYTHQLTVHPTDANHLWYTGIGLYESLDGAVHWTEVDPTRLHPDHHALVAVLSPSCALGLCLFDGNDGGLFFSSGGQVFDSTYQEGLEITQLQSIATSPFTSNVLIGTQDNGAQLGVDGNFELVDRGDAASTVMDADDVATMYDVYVGSPPQRCMQSSGGYCNRNWPAVGVGIFATSWAWYPPLVQDMNLAGGGHPLLFATQQPYRSTDNAGMWATMSSSTPGMPASVALIPFVNKTNYISALGIAKANSSRVYVGYYNGELWTSANAQAPAPTWSRIDTNGSLPSRVVSSIAVHPTNALEVYVAYSGFGTSSVWQTMNAGASWADYSQSSDAGNEFALRPVNALVIDDGFSTHTAWAGTDDGVYTRDLGSASWERSEGIPNVAVNQLVIKDDTLYAATHGRGLWGLSMSASLDLYAVSCCGYISTIDPPPDAVLFGSLFDPNQSCSMTLYEGTRACVTTSTDADGARIATNAKGTVVGSRAGSYANRAMAWFAKNSMLAGGIPSTSCHVSRVDMTCGRRTQVAQVTAMTDVGNPPSSTLRVVPSIGRGATGTVTLAPTLRHASGVVSELCRVSINVTSSTTADGALAGLASAVNATPSCAMAGVSAAATSASPRGMREDDFPAPGSLSLLAPLLRGEELVTTATVSSNIAASMKGLGVPARKLALGARVRFTGTAAGGGTIHVSSRSPLGTCAFDIPTIAGNSAAVIAREVFDAFAAPRTNPTVLPASPACLDTQNARDARLGTGSVDFLMSREITVRSTDASLVASIDVVP